MEILDLTFILMKEYLMWILARRSLTAILSLYMLLEHPISKIHLIPINVKQFQIRKLH